MLRFIKLREEHLELVLRWRTQPEVTQYMFTDVEYDLDRHKAWFAQIATDDSRSYWLISLDDRLIGLVSLHEINLHHKRCSWAFYIGEEDCRLFGGMIAPYVYHYVFEVLGFKKITGEVMEGNENVRKMHVVQGCREVGIFKEHIYKYDRYHDIYLFEMLESDWEGLRIRYSNCIAEFEA
jgi:UDP-4-amino-4,6-dideoxy-N-acetyl-beta-L-altrosamine N-acetyltransferase